MSIRTLHTYAIDCDAGDCDEVYADVVPVQADSLERFAIRDGWLNDDGRHLCPFHAKTIRENLANAERRRVQGAA